LRVIWGLLRTIIDGPRDCVTAMSVPLDHGA
jgi:hypothetical protein